MREVIFLKKNRPKWKRFEEVLKDPSETEPDELADLFVEITDDLSYARTFYPRSRTNQYLNQIAGRVFLSLYRNTPEDWGRIPRFWRYELPALMVRCFPAFALSLVVFLLCLGIGFLSAEKDSDFTTKVLGSDYVTMTLENIKKGNPTGVYQDENAVYMFLRIGLNNLLVSFGIFALGVLGGIGSICTPNLVGGLYGLAPNGIMIGTFFHLFYKYNVAAEAWPVVMIHGTIELSCIVIAAGAGLVMGGGWLFPGTYTRLQSFQRSALLGLKVMVGLIPFIILAAALEAFVTRYADMPSGLKYFILAQSAVLMVGYFVVYPLYLHRQNLLSNDAIKQVN